MCDMDFDDGCDIDMDADIDEGCDVDSDTELGCEMDESMEAIETETGEFPSLDEYDFLIDESNDVSELNDIKEALEDGRYNNETAMDMESEALEDYSLAELEDINKELGIPQELIDELVEENSDNQEMISQIEALKESGRLVIETEEVSDEDNEPEELDKVLKL